MADRNASFPGRQRFSTLPAVRETKDSQIDTLFSPRAFTWLVIGHVVLAAVTQIAPRIAIIHALITLAISFLWALSKEHPERIIYATAYVSGVEVWWRMNEVWNLLPWELGKYTLIGLFILAILQLKKAKLNMMALLFVVALTIPSLQSLTGSSLEEFREQIVFNLGGHIVLLFGATYFSNIEIDKDSLQKLLLALTLPVILAATMALLTIANLRSSGELIWSAGASSVLASAWNGANQTSSVLGLGLTAIWLLLLFWKHERGELIKLIALGGWFLVQALLTFSRGGVFTAALAGLAATAHIFGKSKKTVRNIFLGIIVIAVFSYIVLPQLDQLTGGSLSQRFSDTDPTGRDVIVLTDLEAFLENPLWGVGPGGMPSYRTRQGIRYLAAHTEYSRMLAEHGLLGAFALILLGIMCWDNYWHSEKVPATRAVKIALMAWALLYMTHSATRLVAPAFMLSVTFAQFRMTETLPQLEGPAKPFPRVPPVRSYHQR
ncbi:MAG: O-antigen ligase family protein [Anaerolineae bacterium]|nr:O-antigen ligase family protein [Anaerolineae bacterium]